MIIHCMCIGYAWSQKRPEKVRNLEKTARLCPSRSNYSMLVMGLREKMKIHDLQILQEKLSNKSTVDYRCLSFEKPVTGF